MSDEKGFAAPTRRYLSLPVVHWRARGGQAIIRTTAKVWEIAAGDVEAQAVTRFKTIAGGKGRNGHLQPLTIDDVGSRFFFRHRHQGLEKAAR